MPVSDLVARMGYSSEEYRDIFSAHYHIGRPPNRTCRNTRNVRRSGTRTNSKRPLLIHTNTIDEDVNVLEVEHLIEALKAEKKSFEYEIFQGVPGGHSFDRMDTKQAREIRLKIHRFLAKTLSPPNPFKNLRSWKKRPIRSKTRITGERPMSQKPAALAIGVAAILVLFFIILNPLDTALMAALFVLLLIIYRIITTLR